ncbi:acetate/propionate family kinase [Kineobactrum salinum]|uniref:Acetate kinase n=1 Tax=Kineobactrum salinum TaxID=2708301 RepID=A0A6C0U8G1_9GAMM|nr:acetate kinase [Kineobactrum salinum]QIB65814.1 acetate kinase [Kineobactrum salinum]
MTLLVLNAGSSSLKYQLFDNGSETPRYRGLIDRIGTNQCHHSHTGLDDTPVSCEAADHAAALQEVLARVGTGASDPALRIRAIGHRVVHGGEHFRCATRVDTSVESAIERLIPLAPLHNPGSLAVIRECRGLFPDAPQIAVFDTSFHQSLPERAWRYGVPDSLYRQHGVRRYGFHGISHGHVARCAAEHLGRSDLKLVSLHLGNGASAAAIDCGLGIDTSMGLTPLEGLVMGTRGGDMDPAVIFHLARGSGLDLAQLETLLTTGSGLKGLCGSADMREVLARAENGDASARLALELYTYRIRKYIGAYAAALGGLDALVFTAGVGENAPQVRAQVCAGLDFLSLRVDPARNTAVKPGHLSPIHSRDSGVAVLVIPANEELEIARQVRKLLEAKP